MTRRFHLVPYVLFIISGACGLVYEVTWARYLALFIGYTTLAHMCVLAVFMGGLALGSIWIGRKTRRFRRPLAVYGVLEVAIGLYALVFPSLMASARSAALSAASGLEPGTSAWLVIKILVSFAVLIIPTVLMGGTFPTLMRYYQPESTAGEDKSEWLYLLNCAGAVIGALLAGFVFIPSYGMMFTLFGIGAVNAVLGLCAIGVSYLEPSAEVREIATEAARPERYPLSTLVCAVTAASGLAAMIYELVWIRIFAVTLGSSTYSFTLMLAAFITGIALGSLVVGLAPGIRRHALSSLAMAEIAIGAAVVVSLPVYERLPYIFWRWSSLLSHTPDSYGLFNFMKFSLCFVVMVVPTFFSGMALPLAIKLVARKDERIGEDAGFVYGANTIGTLVGALITGLVLLPFIGMRHSLDLALVINVFAGAAILLVSGNQRATTCAGVACVAVILAVVIMPQWNRSSFIVGTFRQSVSAPRTWQEYQSVFYPKAVYYYSEDSDGTVAVGHTRGHSDRSLFINGKADASSYGDLCTQVLLGQLPMFFNAGARDALVIGLGSGASANSILTHPGTKVDCVEISPSVVRALPYFDKTNNRVRVNKRFNLIVEDARTYVAATRKQYDVVASEPTNPWIAGVGNLFSADYYHFVGHILKPGGIMAQWVQKYEISDYLMQVIADTMLTEFPYVYMFETQGADCVFLASKEPIEPRFAEMENMLKVPAVKRDLDRISVHTVAALLGRQMMTPETLVSLLGDNGPVNSDDQPLLEFKAPEAQFLDERAVALSQADERLTSGRGLFVRKYLGDGPLDRKTTESLIQSYSDPRVHNSALAYGLVRYYISNWPDDWALSMYSALASGRDLSGPLRTAASVKKPGVLAQEVRADLVVDDFMDAQTVFTPQSPYPVLQVLDKALESNPGNQRLRSRREMIIKVTR